MSHYILKSQKKDTSDIKLSQTEAVCEVSFRTLPASTGPFLAKRRIVIVNPIVIDLQHPCLIWKTYIIDFPETLVRLVHRKTPRTEDFHRCSRSHHTQLWEAPKVCSWSKLATRSITRSNISFRATSCPRRRSSISISPRSGWGVDIRRWLSSLINIVSTQGVSSWLWTRDLSSDRRRTAHWRSANFFDVIFTPHPVPWHFLSITRSFLTSGEGLLHLL